MAHVMLYATTEDGEGLGGAEGWQGVGLVAAAIVIHAWPSAHTSLPQLAAEHVRGTGPSRWLWLMSKASLTAQHVWLVWVRSSGLGVAIARGPTATLAGGTNRQTPLHAKCPGRLPSSYRPWPQSALT